jgi:hypothetical protein
MTISSELYPILFALNGRTKDRYEKLDVVERVSLKKKWISGMKQDVKYAYNRHVAKCRERGY